MTKLTYFLYEAFDPQRHIWVRGSWFAPDEEKARFWLQQQGFEKLRLRQSSRSQQTLLVSSKALSLFYRQLGVLLQSGTPLPFALRLVSYSDDQHLSGIARMLETNISNGNYLSTSMARFPRVFDAVSIGLVAAGEDSGRLARTLLEIADAEERRLALRSRVLSSLTYPVVLAGFTLVMTLLFLFYILPLDGDLFEPLGVELPVLNKALIEFSSNLRSPWFPVFLLLSSGATWVWLRQPQAVSKIKNSGFRVLQSNRLTRELLKKAQAVHLLQILALVLSGGGTVERALKLMETAYAEHPSYRTALQRLRQKIFHGEDFGSALETSGIVPKLVSALLSVGYETGRLEEMSLRSVAICEEDVQLSFDTLSSVLEPLFLGIAGVFAAFVVLVAAAPMFQLISVL